MDSLSSHPRPTSRLIDVPRVPGLTESDTGKKNMSSMNDIVLLIPQELLQQIASQVTMKQVQVYQFLIQLGIIEQLRELQLEMLRVAKRDRRSSMSENQKQEILEKRHKAYAMRRLRVGVATNNEHRVGQSRVQKLLGSKEKMMSLSL